jgi:hypothetical protein
MQPTVTFGNHVSTIQTAQYFTGLGVPHAARYFKNFGANAVTISAITQSAKLYAVTQPTGSDQRTGLLN